MMPFIEKICHRYWVLLCSCPIILILAYQLIKSRLGWEFSGNLGSPAIIHWDALLILAFALVLSMVMVWWHEKWGRWLPLLAAAISIIACIGVWLQQDRKSSWAGMDVPTNNYQAALIALDENPLVLVGTWNARANPFAMSTQIPFAMDEVKKLESMGLSWIWGNRWDQRDLPQDNNRMYMHPPGYPLVLSFWLGLFGRSHVVAQSFELFVKFCLLIIALIWVGEFIPPGNTLNRVILASLLATVPPVILFSAPESNELATLFAMAGFLLGTRQYTKGQKFYNAIAGVLVALAGYTNIFNMLVLASVVGVLLLSKPAWKRGLTVYFMLGSGLVVLVFTLLGYYPWLTFFTGTQLANNFRLSHPVDFLTVILGFLYFGIPLLLLTMMGLMEIRDLRGTSTYSWMVAVMISFVAGIYQALALAATARYLIGIIFLLIPLLIIGVTRIKLIKAQALVIPLTNFAFLLLVLFL